MSCHDRESMEVSKEAGHTVRREQMEMSIGAQLFLLSFV